MAHMSDQPRKKPYSQEVKETLTKTLGQRYKEANSQQKKVYWVFITIVCTIIISMWIFA